MSTRGPGFKPREAVMTAQEFQAELRALFPHDGFEEISRRLGIGKRTIRRWAAGTLAVPEHARDQLDRCRRENREAAERRAWDR